jgi:CubicO group peptidase (beta-lactamase class C family)
MSRKLRGADLVTYLTRRVFAPLGIDVGYWQRDAAGHPYLASGVALTARAWGRFGQLLLDEGRVSGRQLVPLAALAECGQGSSSGQRLYILPSAGLVVVRFGHNTGPDYRDDEFLRTLLRS